MKELTLSADAGRLQGNRDSKQWQSLFLAAVVHLALFVFLWVGVQWQSKEPVTVEAEIWDMNVHQAAPLPVIPEPIPEPQVQVVPQQTVAPQESVEDPEIAIAQEKKRQKIEKKKQDDVAREKLREEKLEEQKKKAEELAKLDDIKKKQQEAKMLDKKDKALSDKLFAERMRRLTGQVSNNAGSGGVGDAAKSTGNNRGDPSYLALIVGKIKSKMDSAVIDSGSGNPTVEYRIDLLPDGSLRGVVRKLKSSGIPRFDADVENAIRLAAPYPKDKSGSVPSNIDVVYRLKD